MRYMPLIIMLVISGCATVKETYAPDGRKAYTLNCSGTARGWDKCYAAAGERCGSAGYDILERSDEPLSTSGFVANKDTAVASSTVTKERFMMIACKK